jgi:hypothetical protein
MWMIVAAVVVLCIWYSSRSKSSTAIQFPTLAGNGRFAIEVVGESYYMASFEKICGPRSREGVDMQVRALLTLDDDNKFDKNAVRVSVLGHTVGHLSREAAGGFRLAVKGHRARAFDCAAVIRGGWDDGRGGQGNYGVQLDIL